MKISYVVPGTFHGFDVANALYDANILEIIYTPADMLRVIKWKKKLPLKKVKFSAWPLLKKGKMKRNGDDERILKKIKKDNSNVLIGYPNFSELIFSKLNNKIKILDIDHFNWDAEVCNSLKNKGHNFKYFNLLNPLDPKYNLMQKNELQEEFKLRGIKYTHDIKQEYQKAIECELADIVMVPVSYVKNALIEAGLPKEKILFNPYGYNPNIFYPIKNKQYKNTVMYGGSISYRKGWPYLKQILKHFNGSDIEILVAGGVELNIKNEVDDFFVKSSSNIKYLGPLKQDELAYYMRNVGLFLFPSVLEGFGMTILQSMASGTTVIASKATCGTDLIVNGINGYVIDKEDVSKWIKTIEELSKDGVYMQTLGQKAYTSVKELTWSKYVDNIQIIVEKYK
jgi:glycosyltransferase involved in cell wall biosynthesis